MDYTCAKSVIVSWETGFAVLKIVEAFIHSKLFSRLIAKHVQFVYIVNTRNFSKQADQEKVPLLQQYILPKGVRGESKSASLVLLVMAIKLLFQFLTPCLSTLSCVPHFLVLSLFFPHCSWQRENDNNVQILLSLTSICQGADSLEPSMLHIRLDCRLHNNSRVFAQQWRVVIVLELFWIYELAYSSSTCLEEIFSTFQTSQSIGLEGKEDICCFGTLILLKLSQSKRIFSNRLFRYHFNGFKGLLQKQPAYQQIEFAVLRIVRKKVQNCTHDVFHPFFSLISAEHFFQFLL